jgi:hypothetical protein
VIPGASWKIALGINHMFAYIVVRTTLETQKMKWESEYRLTTTWSNPKDTNAKIGHQIPLIFETNSLPLSDK